MSEQERHLAEDLIDMPGNPLTPEEVKRLLEEIRIAREEWD